MALVVLKCPNCNGEIQLDGSMKQGFCMYCGTKVLNELNRSDTVKIDHSESLRNIINLGISSLEMNDYAKSLECADKALDMDSSCPDAWYLKGCSTISEEDSMLSDAYISKAEKLSENVVLLFDWKQIMENTSCKVSVVSKAISDVLDNAVFQMYEVLELDVVMNNVKNSLIKVPKVILMGANRNYNNELIDLIHRSESIGICMNNKSLDIIKEFDGKCLELLCASYLFPSLRAGYLELSSNMRDLIMLKWNGMFGPKFDISSKELYDLRVKIDGMNVYALKLSKR